MTRESGPAGPDRGDALARIALWAAAALVALAWLAPAVTLPRRVFEGVVVLDITQSMNTLDGVLDGRPVSRLAFAKDRLRHALAQLPCGSRIGWGVFTEYRSYVLLKPVEVCANYSELVAALGHIGGGMAWAGGSQITRGLLSALRISAHMADTPAVIFVTDGHEAPPLRSDFAPVLPDEVTDPHGTIVGVGGNELRPIPKFDPTGHAMGVWGPEDVMQSPPRESIDLDPASPEFAPTGIEHLSSLKQAHLRHLAALTRLGYARLDASTSMLDILLDRQATRRRMVPTDLRGPLALLALPLLFLGIGVRRRLPLAIRRRLAGAYGKPAPARAARPIPARSRLSRT